MPTKKWKDLLEIIKSHPKGISPEELLSEAQYELKEVADFYKNLKEIQKSIIEVKPNNSKKEWPQKISVIIKAKGE